jgi:hypothetical protein
LTSLFADGVSGYVEGWQNNTRRLLGASKRGTVGVVNGRNHLPMEGHQL